MHLQNSCRLERKASSSSPGGGRQIPDLGIAPAAGNLKEYKNFVLGGDARVELLEQQPLLPP